MRRLTSSLRIKDGYVQRVTGVPGNQSQQILKSVWVLSSISGSAASCNLQSKPVRTNKCNMQPTSFDATNERQNGGVSLTLSHAELTILFHLNVRRYCGPQSAWLSIIMLCG